MLLRSVDTVHAVPPRRYHTENVQRVVTISLSLILDDCRDTTKQPTFPALRADKPYLRKAIRKGANLRSKGAVLQ